MRVALVSSEGRCGIAEHSAMLRQYVGAADPSIEFVSQPEWLDPLVFVRFCNQNTALFGRPIDVVHLNYHRGLHSRWGEAEVRGCVPMKAKTVITFHDSYETQPDLLLHDLHAVSSAIVVHEPISENFARCRYWRQGVPEPDPYHVRLGIVTERHRQAWARPIVGTCGFAFPWKGFELLCDAAAAVGWGVLICSHNATDAQVLDWEARNPWVEVDRQYHNTQDLVARLATCDATAFLYQCGNSGTSGAIRLGIATGKTVLAAHGCRQFRDLEIAQREEAGVPTGGVYWVAPNVADVAGYLAMVYPMRFNANTVALREHDSWRHLGKKYAALYRAVVDGTELPQ